MTQKRVKDYYATLGISSTASLEEIRLAYRRQARAYHPDLSTDPDAEERFKEINEAYDILANDDKRQAYDYFTSGNEEPQDATESTVVSAPPATPVTPPTVAPAAAQQPPRQSGPSPSRGRVYPPTWAILLIVLGACIMIAVVIGGVLSLRRAQPNGGADNISVTKLTTFLSPPPIPSELTVLQEDNTPLETVLPTQLRLAGTSFPVAAILPEQGRWPLPADQTTLALWVHGTVINYVIGLPYLPATESLLAGLTPSDQIVLALENGTELAFGSPQAKRVDPADTAPMSQERPGLTLVMLGGDQPSRLTVTARYLPEAVKPSLEQRADGLAVSVLDAAIAKDTGSESSQSWTFVVEYAVTNTLSTAVTPALFALVLEDASGQRYVLNETATGLGNAGRLTEPVAPGAAARGSAGYVIPRTVRAPLSWHFRADATSSDQATFVLGFEPQAGSGGAGRGAL